MTNPLKITARYAICDLMIFATLTANSAQAQAPAPAPKTTQQECFNADYSNRFGPVQNQDGIGLCWAYTAAGLLEEAMCLRNDGYCQKSVSPVSVSRCDWTLGKSQEGNAIHTALDCGLSKGFCESQYTPIPDTQPEVCKNLMYEANSALACMAFVFKEAYLKIKEAGEDCKKRNAPFISDSNFNSVVTLYYESYMVFQSEPSTNILEFANAALTSNSEYEFLEKVYVNNKCHEHGILPQDPAAPTMKAQTVDLRQSTSQQKVAWTKAILQSGRSAGASICVLRAIQEINGGANAQSPVGGDDCGGHAVIFNGMRWNNEKQRCEVNVRNSWGKDSSFEGWYDVDYLMKQTYLIDYIDGRFK